MRVIAIGIAVSLIALAQTQSANGSLLVQFADISGLSAEVEFTIVDSTTVTIRLRNTSTGVPAGFGPADQLLTGLSWDAGGIGINAGDPEITGGTIVTGPNSFSLNFSVTNVGANANIGGEWGYGNANGSNLMYNFISGNSTGTTLFGGPNLDGPANPDGPQAGLLSAAFQVPLGGIGAIQDELIATITLSHAITSYDDLLGNGVRIEFGSDAAFLATQIPAPSAALVLLGGLAGSRNRRR